MTAKFWSIAGAIGSTLFAIGWLLGVSYAAPNVPVAPYSATIILPAQKINCSAAANALTFDATAITVDCSADRVFASGFQQP